MMTREIRILGIGKHWGREETRHCHLLSISKRCLKLDYQKFYIGGIAKDIELKKNTLSSKSVLIFYPKIFKTQLILNYRYLPS